MTRRTPPRLAALLAGTWAALALSGAVYAQSAASPVSEPLALRDSLRRANEATTRRIGINMLAEINAEDDLPQDPPAGPLDLTSAGLFFRDWCQGITVYPVCPCDSAQFFTAYLRWCRESEEIPCARNALSEHVAKQKGWQVKVKRRYTDLSGARVVKSARMVLPPPIVLETTSLEGADFRRSRFGDEAEWATAGYRLT